MRTIAKVRRDAQLPLFVTLTWPDDFPSPGESKRYLDIFYKRLLRRWPQSGSIWKLEPQERGAPHFHLLVWGVECRSTVQDDIIVAGLQDWVPQIWFEIAGGGDENHLRFHRGDLKPYRPCVEPVQTWRGVWAYAAKYLGKTFEVAGWSDKWTGRFWGKVNPGLIPFGEEKTELVTRKHAVHLQRYQRRFAGLHHAQRTATIFCDADQWVTRLLDTP